MSTEEKLKNIENKKIKGTFFRFQSEKYFHANEADFYKNFLETSHTYTQQSRFAPYNAHSGFYFGASRNVAIAEIAHYNNMAFSKKLDDVNPEEILLQFKERQTPKIFLSVEIEIDNIVCFTDAEVVETYLRYGTMGYKRPSPEYRAQFLTPLVNAQNSGNDFTDVLGVDARSLGANGVIFPSTRAMQFDGWPTSGNMIRMGHDSAQPGGLGSNANIMELYWQLESQMEMEFNLVVFSGSALTRAISGFEWIDATGKAKKGINKYFGLSNDELEDIRLNERQALGLDYFSSIRLGLLSDEEIKLEFENEFRWARE